MSKTDWEQAQKLLPEILKCIDAGNRTARPTALIAGALQWAREEGVKLALDKRMKDYEELLHDVRAECAKVIGPARAFVVLEPPAGVVRQAFEKLKPRPQACEHGIDGGCEVICENCGHTCKKHLQGDGTCKWYHWSEGCQCDDFKGTSG